MTSDETIRCLREHWAELCDLSVSHLALFGSVARDEARPDSDVDLLVEFDRPIGLFHLFRVQHRLEEMLHTPRVDLIQRGAIRSELRDHVFSEAVDVA